MSWEMQSDGKIVETPNGGDELYRVGVSVREMRRKLERIQQIVDAWDYIEDMYEKDKRGFGRSRLVPLEALMEKIKRVLKGE